ncbi:MAG: succinylglutamate desuccinylase/aspartoacylase family protein [Gammaproteobacteria bacterium]|nr:succinylglutamate desuccinylase/aspartoacylase family protein [Gammaproteobacteria bacterium]
MNNSADQYRIWSNPAPEEIGEDHIAFLKILGEPAWLTFDGKDNSRSRAIVTLLHGNEPSGLKALHNWIKKKQLPETRLGIFVASVNAALHTPILSHRYLPHEKDFNRCFNPPYHCHQGKLAARLIDLLSDFSPEAVIDTHNTSAHSEAFAVAGHDSPAVRQLTQMFTRKLVVMHRKMGTLIERARDLFPVVTVEFGGFNDPRSDLLAEETLEEFIHRRDLFNIEPGPLQVLRDPHRLEVTSGHILHYASSIQDKDLTNADITIFNTIDQLNFTHVSKDTRLGWLAADGLAGLRVTDEAGHNLLNRFFFEKDGFLMTAMDINIFMATTDPYIARDDCLLYLTAAE